MLGDDYYKGYITVDGLRVEDGLKNRPAPFSVGDKSVVLRWIHPTGLRTPSFECELRISKEHARFGNYPFNQMNMGVAAYERFMEFIKHKED